MEKSIYAKKPRKGNNKNSWPFGSFSWRKKQPTQRNNTLSSNRNKLFPRNFSGCRNLLKRLLLALILSLLLLLLWYVLSNFNPIRSTKTWIKEAFERPNYSTIISEEDKDSFIDEKNTTVSPIAPGYYEVISRNKDIVDKGVANGVIYFPKPIEISQCNNSDKYWHLSNQALDYNGFVYDYINSKKEKDMVVAILDSGIDTDNKSLISHIPTGKGINIADNNNNFYDSNGHGTHIAGIILQTFPGATILPIKINNGDSDFVSETNIIKGLRYAIDQDVDIINLSFGNEEENEVTKLLIDEAVSKNIIVIAAAGNESQNVKTFFPANYQPTISVGATNKTSVSDFSNIGADNNMPGECIFSNYTNGNMEFLDGTSMSTPQLGGVLAAYISINKGISLDKNSILAKVNSSLVNHGNVAIVNVPKLLNIEKYNNDFFKRLYDIQLEVETLQTKLTLLQSNLSTQSINNLINDINKSGIQKNSEAIKNIYKGQSIIKGAGLSLIIKIDDYNKLLINSFDKNAVQLITNESILTESLGTSSCYWIKGTEGFNKKYCTSEEKKWGCSTDLEGHICGIFSILIESGTKLPTSNSDTYTTVQDGQTGLPFPIYQGENEIAQKNKGIGELNINGLPKKAKGEAGAYLTFEIDKYGYLNVKAVDKDNSKNQVKTTIRSFDKMTKISDENIGEFQKKIEILLKETNNILNEINAFYKIDPYKYIQQNNHQSPTIIDVVESTKTELEKAFVSKVIDGDTIKVSINNKETNVRLIGIDAPENSTLRYGKIECFGSESTKYLIQLLDKKEVELMYDQTQMKYDKYDRLLAYVMMNGININKLMLENGYAKEYTYNKPYIFQKEFKEAEKVAKQSMIGLWNKNTCNGKS